jgi:MoxR-like ATPase
MPNVAGLLPADALIASLPKVATRSYGRHATVKRSDLEITLTDAKTGVVIARVVFPAGFPATGKPRVSAKLPFIDGDTVSAVNAFLKPYGKVKVYWRTGERRWLPASGGAPVRGPKPAAKASTPAATAHLAPDEVVVPRPAPEPVEDIVVPVAADPKIKITVRPGAHAVVSTETTYEGHQPKIKDLTAVWSQVGSVLVPKRHAATLERAWTLRQAGKPAFIKVTGPAGTAKTKLAEQFAFTKDVPFLLVEGQGIQTATDWFGSFVPSASHASGFDWVWNDFGKALIRGTPMVILIDELNRVENERALNGLMGLLAWTARTMQPGMPHALTLNPGIMVMATVNEGVEYVATVEVDAAVNDRLGKGIRLDYPPVAIEPRILKSAVPGLDNEVAKRLAKFAATQRKQRDDDAVFPSHNVISTRVLIGIAEDIVLGGATPSEAIWANCESRFIPEDFDGLKVLIEAQFGPDAVATSDDDDLEMERLIASLD